MNRRRFKLCILAGMMMLGGAALCHAEALKNGMAAASEKALVQKVSGAVPVGTRVQAVMDSPSESLCIRAGFAGTVVCYDPNDPVRSYLVDWDEPCGFAQSQVCGNLAENGWWVSGSEIEVLATNPCALTHLIDQFMKIAGWEE